jgi:hypothetical protein
MSAASSRTFPIAFRASMLGIFAVAACSGQMTRSGSATGSSSTGSSTTGDSTGSTGMAGSNNPDQVVSGAAGSGMVSMTGAAGTESIISTGAGGSGPPPNLDNCTGALPGSYNTLCSGCHNQAGQANSRYPDLYKFMGNAAAFLTQVRTGGMAAPGGPQMAAYPATLISDADVMKIFSYFTGQGGMRPTLDSVSLGGVVPLFQTTDAKNGPIVFTRDDGAIITRGAGRVRGRHEKEGSFGQFLENYFDNRTYGSTTATASRTGATGRSRATTRPSCRTTT